MKYKIYGMNSLGINTPPNRIDGFVFFSTKESRSWNVLTYLKEQEKFPCDVFSIEIEGVSESHNFSNINFRKINFTHSKISSNLTDTMLSCLSEINKYISNKNIIGLDISVMPTPVFAQILHFLIERHNDKKIIIYYTEPEHYNLDNLFDFNPFDGEIDIKAIPGFEGKTAQINNSQRIIFYIMGFEMNHLNKLIPQQINPDGVVPINGFPAYFPKYKDISLINNDVDYHEMDIKVVFSEANNPFEIYNQMCILQKRYHDYCIDIVPAGSKPMALGACLFALMNGNKDIRILFPFPKEYSCQKSIGNGKIWEYII